MAGAHGNGPAAFGHGQAAEGTADASRRAGSNHGDGAGGGFVARIGTWVAQPGAGIFLLGATLAFAVLGASEQIGRAVRTMQQYARAVRSEFSDEFEYIEEQYKTVKGQVDDTRRTLRDEDRKLQSELRNATAVELPSLLSGDAPSSNGTNGAHPEVVPPATADAEGLLPPPEVAPIAVAAPGPEPEPVAEAKPPAPPLVF